MDTALLDTLARPGGWAAAHNTGLRPPQLNEIFQRVASGGWRPRIPAVGAELERCEIARTRGDCLSPLILQGDTVFVDPHMRPMPGDIVQFRLSQRLADEQNANPPPGQLPSWRVGDPWLKLFAPFSGIDLLHERHGGSIAATLACCESPDGTPVLHTVRNVMRAGELLFLPDVYMPQISVGAATNLAYTVDDATYATSFSGTTLGATYPGVSFAVPYVSSPILNFTATTSQTIICTAMGTVYFTSTGTTQINAAWMGIALIDTTNPSANVLVGYTPQAGHSRSFNNMNTQTTTATSPTMGFAFQMEESVTEGNTYALVLFCQTEASQITAQTTSTQLQVETIRR